MAAAGVAALGASALAVGSADGAAVSAVDGVAAAAVSAGVGAGAAVCAGLGTSAGAVFACSGVAVDVSGFGDCMKKKATPPISTTTATAAAMRPLRPFLGEASGAASGESDERDAGGTDALDGNGIEAGGRESVTGASNGGGASIGAEAMGPPPRFSRSSQPARPLFFEGRFEGRRPDGSSSSSFCLAAAFSVAVSAESEKRTEFSLRSPTWRSRPGGGADGAGSSARSAALKRSTAAPRAARRAAAGAGAPPGAGTAAAGFAGAAAAGFAGAAASGAFADATVAGAGVAAPA